MVQKQPTPNTKEIRKYNGGKPVLKLGTNLKAGAYVGLVVTTGWGSGQQDS